MRGQLEEHKKYLLLNCILLEYLILNFVINMNTIWRILSFNLQAHVYKTVLLRDHKGVPPVPPPPGSAYVIPPNLFWGVPYVRPPTPPLDLRLGTLLPHRTWQPDLTPDQAPPHQTWQPDLATGPDTGPPPPPVDRQKYWKHYLPVILRMRAVIICCGNKIKLSLLSAAVCRKTEREQNVAIIFSNEIRLPMCAYV